MKQFLLWMVIFIFQCFAGYGQLKKNTFVVGGSYAYDTSESDALPYSYEKSKNLEISPGMGYFLSSYLLAGLKGAYIQYHHENISGNSSKVVYSTSYRTLAVAPYIRYFKPIKGNLYLTGELGGGIGLTNYTNRYVDSTIRKSNELSFRASFRPGIVYLIGNRLGLDFSIGNISYYAAGANVTHGSVTNKNKDRGFSLSFDLSSVKIGFLYCFAKRERQ